MSVSFFFFFFFFSSRRRHTRCGRDWSSACALPISVDVDWDGGSFIGSFSKAVLRRDNFICPPVTFSTGDLLLFDFDYLKVSNISIVQDKAQEGTYLMETILPGGTGVHMEAFQFFVVHHF